MALPALSSSSAPSVDCWLPLTIAAQRLALNEGHLRRKCRDEWEPAGRARKQDDTWWVSPAADPRLRERVDEKARDLAQEADLAARGVAPRYLEIAKARRDVLNGLAAFALHAAGHSKEKVLALYLTHLAAQGAGRGPRRVKRSTFYKWQEAYEADGLSGLVPAFAYRDSAQALACGAAALDYIERCLNAGNKIKLPAAIQLAMAEAAGHAGDLDWQLGSYSSIRLAIAARRPKIMATVADKGPRAARASCVAKLPRNFEAIGAGDEYVGDERRLDVWCRLLTPRGWKAIRPWLTCWMDMRSRVIVGWLLGRQANRFTINGALKIALAKYGKPLALRTDRGRDYKAAAQHGALRIRAAEQGGVKFSAADAERLTSILADLSIEVRPVEAYAPWAKPIESFFKTMKEHFDKLLAAFWGGCPSERHEDRQRWLVDNLHKLPTLEELTAHLATFFETYHATPHGAHDLFGKTPMQALAEFRGGPIRRETTLVLDHLFKEFVGPKQVRRDGVRHNGRWYGHGDPRLIPFHGKKRVLLAIQPDDQGRAQVCDVRTKQPLFTVECLAIEKLTREEVAEIKRRQRRSLRPYEKAAKDARDWMLHQDAGALLDQHRRGVEAASGRTRRETNADAVRASGGPSLTVVRPELETSIAQTGPAPSDLLDAASKLVRTGTDDAPFGVDSVTDFLGDDEGSSEAPPASEFDPWSLVDLEE